MSSRRARKPTDYPTEYPLFSTQQIEQGKHRLLCKTYTTERTIHIYLGGKEAWCVYVSLSRTDAMSPPQPMGYLDKVQYDQLCSLNHSLERSGGGTVLLLKIMIQYIAGKYPTVTHLHVLDASTRKCNNHQEVNLAVMSYLISGQTWYMKYIGAEVAPEYRSQWDKFVRGLTDAKDLPWEIMHEIIADADHNLPMTEEEMGQLYQASPTWQAFFRVLVDASDIGRFCQFMSSWQSRFIRRYFTTLQDIHFHAPIVSYSLPMTITPYQEGRGRRGCRHGRPDFTRKRRPSVHAEDRY